MKKIFRIISILLLIFSCKSPNEKNISGIRKDTATKSVTENQKQIEEQDSVYNVDDDYQSLLDALKFSHKNRNKKKFNCRYIATMPDSSYNVDIEINNGFYFSNNFPHLIIRRSTPSFVYIDIFSKTDTGFKKVVSHKQETLEYIKDTIKDINGDGLKDFLINWYGNTGCCLKGFSNVYLLRSDKKLFSKTFKFINPTFSPKEKIIRGVCYGQPGQTAMYKYKWNGEAIDTLEYVYFDKNDNGVKTGKITIPGNEPYTDKTRVLKKLNFIPPEYKTIEGYDWFTGKGY